MRSAYVVDSRRNEMFRNALRPRTRAIQQAGRRHAQIAALQMIGGMNQPVTTPD
jgi:hypothetical protein